MSHHGLRVRWFDLGGILSILCLAGVAMVDFGGGYFTSAEAPLQVTSGDLATGFRPGVSWFGIYLGDAKVGFARVERRRGLGGPEAISHLTLRPVVMGRRVTIETDLAVTLDENLKPVTFGLRTDAAGLEVRADGRREDGEFVGQLDFGGGRRPFRLPAAGTWTELGLRPAFLKTKPSPGDRRESRILDPTGIRTVSTTIEYVGIESMAVLDRETRVHHLRQTIGGQTFDVWVNDLGEALREEMPLGLLAVRETEAAATYGFGRGAPPPADASISAAEIRKLLGGFAPEGAGGEP